MECAITVTMRATTHGAGIAAPRTAQSNPKRDDDARRDMPDYDPAVPPPSLTAGAIAELREVMSRATDGRHVAAEIRGCTERLNEAFRAAALLGLKVEFEIGETYLNVVGDEHARHPTAYIRCKVFAEMTGD